MRGLITAKRDGAAVSGAIVALVDSTGRAVATTLADDRGAFLLVAPAAGNYAVRVDRVGFRATRSGPHVLALGQTLELPITIGSDGVSLQGVRVTADRRCVVRPQEGLAAAQLWDEARKALSSTQLTQMAQGTGRGRRDPHRFTIRARKFVRELDPQTLAARHSEEFEQEAESVTPFVSADPTQLAREGYVVPEADGGATYFAPDATVLLSDVFLDTHCFRLQAAAKSQQGDLIGLAFEPASSVRAPPTHLGPRVDIRGVLWLDRGTAELRYMEYAYANLQLEAPSENIGGLLEFRPLPDGRWIVWHWYIRMPLMQQRRVVIDPVRQLSGELRTQLTAIKEEGGTIVEVLPPGAHRPTLAVLHGIVVDSLRGAPVSGARVFLSGTSHSAITDADGSYQVDSVPPGRYTASLILPRLDSLLLDAPAQPVALSAGIDARIDFAVPSLPTLVRHLCPQLAPTDSSLTILVGLVRDTTGRLAADVTVRAQWKRFAQSAAGLSAQPLALATESLSGGRYAICGLPDDQRLAIVAQRGRARSDSVVVRLAPRELRRVDLTLRPR